MSKRTRYAILLAGFLFFITISPLVVLYVRGIVFDFTTRQFVKTGILAVVSEPKAVVVLLDDKQARTGSGDVKFLRPGPYMVTLQKSGYQNWSKKLFINPGEVTWVNAMNNKVYLLFENPQQKTVAENVSDFYSNESSLVYILGKTLIMSPLGKAEESQNYVLPKTANTIVASPNGKSFVFTEHPTKTAVHAMVFNSETRTITDISGMFSTQPRFEFSTTGQLYAQENNTLYLIETALGKKNPVLSGIKAFSFQKNNLYYIQENSQGVELLYTSLPVSEGQTLVAGLPSFSTGEIIISFERQAFLLLDKTLYKVSSTLEKMGDNVSAWNFNKDESTLTFFHGGELNYYNPFNNSIAFVSRTSQSLTSVTTNINVNYSFYIRDNKATALDLDTRDHQNEYILYSGANLQKFIVNKNATRGFVLDGGVLKEIKIR